MKELILGGARSGKSRLAEQRAGATQQDVLYIATAQAYDDEMNERIARHQNDRPPHWQTLEEPLYLGRALQENAKQGQVILVDCLTLWLSNLLCMDDPSFFETEKKSLLECYRQLPGQLILVSNEVGQGIVPDNALARRFIDEAGWLHQSLAAQSDQVTFVTAGLAQQLKP
ncbi:bifunctional adenosylcobinamide kinase/adenosylcobinamide-phosphate guanylyltransferase [Alkalimarinus sediminis]|uniref:Bifunctional adenosylcobalamin biosynthesis protein n=1 Tax=Alkalimarinus sediminis TaxID=1632866 RepID=A0A9E8KQV5_9ALTE|nr:bifunctional adenosylcobinamide kinase/adenosylcobinamide-phosphate guanylyltransferase [Alkalimarinus sediminis]UZW75262.1 bifunctional adenosylcobinamide kinase/adenosylcobinamide-phosphate guanylyltransferase [Alkalimarinus sediminis]